MKLLNSHISGNLKSKDSYKLVKFCKEYFNGKIPNELKYQGTVYRILQFKTKEKFQEKCMIPLENQKYWSCTKSLESIPKIKQYLSHKNYKYYIIFKFDVTYDDVLFDMNKMVDYLGEKTPYREENEIIVLTENFSIISSKNIIEQGKTTKKEIKFEKNKS